LTHEALFYSDVEEFLLGTLAFVRDGLAAGQPVLVAVPEPRLSLLRAELAEAAAPGGAVRLVDMVEVGRNPNRILPWVLSAFVHEHLPGSVRVVGEPLYLGRTPEEIAPCVQHEALINVAFAGVPATIMCPYDAVRLPQVLPHVLAYAEWTHPVLAGRAGRLPSTNYRPPQSVVALLNQPLPEPRRVGASMDFDAHGLAGVRAQVAKIAEDGGHHGGPGTGICRVGEHGRLAGAPLHQHLEAGLDQPAGHVRHERDTALSRRRFPRHP
jgi:hypothetical protein